VKSLSPGAKGLMFAAGAALIWTFFILLSRLSTRTSFNPFDLAFLRFSAAALAVGLILALRPRAPAGAPYFAGVTPPRALALALFGGAGFTALAYTGFVFAPAAHASVLMPGTLPLSAALIAWAVLGDPITRRKAAGLAAIIGGVVLVGAHALAETPQAGDENTWIGDVAFPFASVSWAFFTVYIRKWKVGAVDATILVCLICFVLYVPAYLLWAPKKLALASINTILITAFFQGVIALVVSMWFFTRAVAALGPTKTTMVTSVVPALSAVLAVPLLGEPLSVYLVLGVAAVTAGMLIGITGAPLKPTPVPASAS
jgi:drug/metabolite transporter (DMT)-like permease